MRRNSASTFDVGRRDHVAVVEVAEVQLHGRLEAPFQRHLVDRDRALLLPQLAVHRGVEVVGRIEVRAVVRGQRHALHGPAFAIGQVALAQAGEEGRDLPHRVLVREVFDLRREGGRVRHHVVLEVDGEVDELPCHGKTSVGTRRSRC
jgi:hypothetical protein